MNITWKKILLVLLIPLIILAAGAVVYFYHSTADSEQKEDGGVAEVENVANVNASNGILSLNTMNESTSNEGDVSSNSTTAGNNGSQILFDRTRIDESAKAFSLVLFDINQIQSAFNFISDNVPARFDNASNMALRFSRENGFFEFQQYEQFSDPSIISCAFIASDGRYGRYASLVSAKSLGGRGQEAGVVFEAGREAFYQVDVTFDSMDGKVVFLHVNAINPVSVPMVEQQYDDIINDLDAFDDEYFVRAFALAAYSYSPFIDEKYWTTLSKHMSYSNAATLQSEANMVDRMLSGWRLSGDGRGYRVREISLPVAVGSDGNCTHYICEIVYCSDNRQWGDGSDKETSATLHVYLNSSAKKVIGLAESDVSVAQAQGRQYREDDLTFNPTIEMLLADSQ